MPRLSTWIWICIVTLLPSSHVYAQPLPTTSPTDVQPSVVEESDAEPSKPELTPEVLALRLLDREALFTVSGGLKPVSEGFWRTQIPAGETTTVELKRAREIAAALPLGPHLEIGFVTFVRPDNGQRSVSAFIAHRLSLRRLIVRRADFFRQIGVSPEMSPQEVMDRVEGAPSSLRWKGFGLVFGYPDHAVDFFVTAGESQRETGQFVKRDFFQIPTFESATGRFVFAVPVGHISHVEDLRLKNQAASILSTYRAWRKVYLSAEGAGAEALLKTWTAYQSAGPIVSTNNPQVTPRRGRLRFWRCDFRGCHTSAPPWASSALIRDNPWLRNGRKMSTKDTDFHGFVQA
ncbi:MAG: hypothetical protein WD045_16255 [Pirellulaceae bacterium]